MTAAPSPSDQPPSVPPRIPPRLARRLGLGDAVVLGLGSMLGAGVFAAVGPAAAVAGSWLLVALVVAGVVAYANATSSGRLAAIYPESGGTYVYGRRRLGPGWGFAAGWGFVVGKTASCAAMALTLGAYAWPEHPRPVAAGAVLAFTGINCLGITKTARVTRVLVALTLATLVAVVVGALTAPAASAAQLVDGVPTGPLGVLQASGLLFFAFAGYARIATLGEEVRDPARTVPRAIPLALGIVVLVYAVVATAALASVGPAALAASSTPLATAAGAGGGPFAMIVRVGGGVAAAGVLLSLLAGVGRTVLAMARDHELPRGLTAVHPHRQVPHRAQTALGALVLVLVLAFDLRSAIALSSCTVLLYYAITNIAALGVRDARPRRGTALAVLGLIGCLVLAVTLPAIGLLGGLAVVGAGLVGRLVVRRRPSRRPRLPARRR